MLIIVRFLQRLFFCFYRFFNKRFFNSYFGVIAQKNNYKSINSTKKQYHQWASFWGVFGMKPSRLIFDVYSHYNKDMDLVVPNDIARSYIEPILTPGQFQPFYNDKNSFDLFIDKGCMPRTLFRSMNSHLLNAEYESINGEEAWKNIGHLEKVVVKPTTDMGGRGVSVFSKKGNRFEDSAGNILSIDFLSKHYKTNYIVQECIVQSDFMSQFNPSSINTLRIATYRNINTGVISVIGAVMRMGGRDSFVDNACSGGVFVSVDQDGVLGNYVCDEFGRTKSVHNGIDFSTQSFIIPNYSRVKEFAINLAKRFPHMSLFANDIAITSDGNPIMIEVNTQMFSYWLYQFTGRSVFGKDCKELIDYCLHEQKSLEFKLSINKKS